MASSRETTSSGGSLSDLIVGFFGEIEAAGDGRNNDGEDGEEAESSSGSTAESRAFWDTQRQHLEEALGRNSSVERRIRKDIEEAVRRMESGGLICSCSNSNGKKNGCRNCALDFVAQRLRDDGYNSAVCKSKWSRSSDIPSGEHRYVDVVVEAKNANRNPTRIVMELNFRAEFEMARASPEYTGLVGRVPELFVGKFDRLKAVVKIMCAAAKQCMRDNNMHMGPWRTQKYMQSKWLSPPDRIAAAPFIPTVAAGRQPKPRASMLTSDLHCTVAGVV